MAKASANLFPYVHLVPAAAPSSPAAGSQRLYLDSGNSNKLSRKDSSGTVVVVEGAGSSIGTYGAYTPALTAATTNPTIGTGGGAGVTGRYIQIGTGSASHVEGTIYFQFGSSGVSAGSGAYRLSVPVNIAAPGSGYAVGYGFMTHGASMRTCVLGYLSATTIQMEIDNTGVGSSAVPWAWGAGDAAVLHFAYEAA